MNEAPEASVIIPTCRRPDLVARCLDCLATQTIEGKRFEIIVVDDDPARSALPMLKEHYGWVQTVHGPSKGPGAARNAGAALARSAWLIFVDDDCVPTPGWVEAFLASADETKVLMGRTTCDAGCTDPFDHAPINLNGLMRFSCNFAIPADTFNVLGGFDEGFAKYGFEDFDFFRRSEGNGFKTVFVPRASVDHPARQLGGAWSRAQTQVNFYRYQLKYGEHPRLSSVLMEIIGAWKSRLRRPASPLRRLQAALSVALEMFYSIAFYDRFFLQAQRSLNRT